ncbi:MAG: hypothetical protein ACOCZS_00795 [Verrucomicrobiota bacterium]
MNKKKTDNNEVENKVYSRVTPQDAARVHRHTLIEINLPVFTARRDAAHQEVLTILRHRMMNSGKELREVLYAVCVKLLDDAVECTQRSQVQADSPVLHYFNLLRDTIAASLALVRHEMTVGRESEEFSRILNEYVVSQLETTNEVFSDSEMNILDCIEDLLKFGDPILQQDSDERRKNFIKDDKRRYDLALDEYKQYYQNMHDNAVENLQENDSG